MTNFVEIARGNIERHLGDCFNPDHNASSDEIYDEVYTLAFDAIFDAGGSKEQAQKIALELAQGYAAL